jgi:hypothetical protein
METCYQSTWLAKCTNYDELSLCKCYLRYDIIRTRYVVGTLTNFVLKQVNMHPIVKYNSHMPGPY